jgi:hypothetical protein
MHSKNHLIEAISKETQNGIKPSNHQSIQNHKNFKNFTLQQVYRPGVTEIDGLRAEKQKIYK